MNSEIIIISFILLIFQLLAIYSFVDHILRLNYKNLHQI